MDVVLINSPLFRSQNEILTHHFLHPIGLGYIETYLIENNINVELIDTVKENISIENLIIRLNQEKPKFIGINIFTTNYVLVKDIVEKIDYNCNFIIGGLSTKTLYKKIFEWETSNQIDVVVGDGEYITLDVVNNSFKEKCLLETSKRRVFWIDKNSKYFICDIDSLNLNRHLFKEPLTINIKGKKEMNIVTSRGCIYNCSYCAAATSQNVDFPVRERSSDSIISELYEIKNQFPSTQSIRILDDLFLKSKNSILKAIKIFSKFDFEWRAMAHINTFNNTDQSLIESMRACGCNELFIGVESGSNRIRREMNKMGNVKYVKENISKIFQAKINIKGYFIYGFPGETLEDITQTYTLAKEIKELSLKFGVEFRASVFQFRPYHGTEIFDHLLKSGITEIEDELIQNSDLTGLIGREQFNFYNHNYTNVCFDTILEYICMTNNL
jgi:radical SAM superfamily enzyme YgiQ (UPF0313 family)